MSINHVSHQNTYLQLEVALKNAPDLKQLKSNKLAIDFFKNQRENLLNALDAQDKYYRSSISGWLCLVVDSIKELFGQKSLMTQAEERAEKYNQYAYVLNERLNNSKKEVGPSNLHEFAEKQLVPEYKATVIAYYLILDLKNIHDRGILHGKLELAKILLNEDGVPKIITFEEDGLGHSSKIDKAQDIWDLGCVLYGLAYGGKKVSLKTKHSSDEALWRDLGIGNSEFDKIIKGFLRINPKKRETLAGMQDFLEKESIDLNNFLLKHS